MKREEYEHKAFIYDYSADKVMDDLFAEIESIESKLTIALKFIQDLRDKIPKLYKWDELDKTLEEIK